MSSSSPSLWVVAIPIGNLGDISDRAKQVLSTVDLVLAEDTRSAGALFQLLGIDSKSFVSLFSQNEGNRVQSVLQFLDQGKEIALISEAGTPVISDPGSMVVQACHKAGFPVRSVPGPCAPIAALMVSGFQAQPFTFLGFLPRKEGEKKRIFSDFIRIRSTLLFFERKSRLKTSLGLAYEILGDREVCLARELTKMYEEVTICSLAHIPETLTLRGEFTVVIGPSGGVDSWTSEQEVRSIVIHEMKQGGKPKELIGRIAGKVRGWSRKELYKLYLELKNELKELG